MSHPLEQKIEIVRRHARRLVRVHGLSWFLAITAFASLFLGLLDYYLRPEGRWERSLLTAALAGVAGWALYRFAMAALLYRAEPVRLAQALERNFPGLSDKLSSSLEFLRQPADDPLAGSADLRRAVVSQTLADVEAVDLTTALDQRPARRALVTLLVVVALICLAFWTDAAAARQGAQRLILLGGAWPRWNDLSFVDPPQRLARGADFVAELTDRNGRLPDEVDIYYIFDGERGRVHKRPMKPRGDRMLDRLENVTRSFRFRAVGGDDREMPWTKVAVEEPPRIEDLTVRTEPPAYTGLPAATTDGHVRALVGTSLSLRAHVDRPLVRAELRSDPPDLVAGVSVELEDNGRSIIAAPSGGEWIVTSSGSYWLELQDQQGVRAASEVRWQIAAVTDEPPTVSLEQPSDHAAVTSGGVLPLKALVKDDLGLASVELRYTRSTSPDADEQIVTLIDPDELDPQTVEAADLNLAALLAQDHSRTVEFEWPLNELPGLKPGESIEFYVAAQDRVPQTGRSTARRVAVISADEFEDRLAQRRAAILQQLNEALQIQRQAHAQVVDLNIQLDTAGTLLQQDVDHLQSAELNQRHVMELLTDSSGSVAEQLAALLDELKNNRVNSPEVEERMRDLQAEILALQADELPVIERELVAASKLARTEADERSQNIRAGLEIVATNQAEVIATLEELLGQLSQWDSYRRFARDIQRIQDEQQAMQSETESLRLELLTEDLRNLDSQQLARLKRLAERQFELARRFDKLQSGMQEVQSDLEDRDSAAADTLTEALDVARQAAIGGQMRESGRAVEQNRMGQALTEQSDVSAGLGEMLDVLANRGDHDLSRVAEKLADAAAELGQLEQQQSQITGALDDAAGEANADKRRGDLQNLTAEQQALSEATAALAEQIQRLRAGSAASAAETAASEMQQAAESAQGDLAEDAIEHAQNAEQQLSEARSALEQAVQNTEQDLAAQRMQQLQLQIATLSQQHAVVLDEAEQLHDLPAAASGGLNVDRRDAAMELAARERTLAEDAAALAADSGRPGALSIALENAAADMLRASSLLHRGEVGAPAQQALRNAQRRLDQLAAALAPPSPPEPMGDTAQSQPPAIPPPGTSQDRPQMLAELRLLKVMQQEINERTLRLEQERGRDGSLTEPQQQELRQLQTEQGRLVELLQDVIAG